MSKRTHEFEAGGDTVVKKLKSDLVSHSFPSKGEYLFQARSNIVSITFSFAQTTENGKKIESSVSTDDLIAQKRAEIAAKMAAMTGKRPTFSPNVINNLNRVPATTSNSVASVSQPLATPTATEDLARRVAEAKRRVADAQTKIAIKDNPYLSMPQTGKKKVVESAPQGAGLKMAAHPLLLDTSTPAPQSNKDRYKPMQPKFASIKANVRNAPTPTPPPAPSPAISTSMEAKANPYASKDNVSGAFEGAAPRERSSRSLRFNQKGKYIQIANQMRQEAQLEQLKQRIAESARKVGFDSEFETVERNIRREAPPQAEWWDVALLPNKTYDDISLDLSALNIRTPESPINLYVQHPIPIPAPGDKAKVELKPLLLTKKEQKKMRKQKRQAELQDKRDRVRMGLVPPDPPKVRLANLMKVLTSDAVQDPTRVEARVRREVAMRKHNHVKMNAERRLTDEQRREKIEIKKHEEERKGLVGAVFKIKTLADPSHRFKVRKNAEQMNLTGLCIFHPLFSMIYVEGAGKYIRNYKRLLLHRIQWTQAAPARGNDGGEDDETGIVDGDIIDQVPVSSASQEADGYGSATLDDNRCDLIWEGDLRERVFKNFKPRSCPTDTLAKEALGTKLAGYWDQTKNWKPQDDELL